MVRALDPTNDLEFFRVKSKKHEVSELQLPRHTYVRRIHFQSLNFQIMIAPDQDFVIMVIQSPSQPTDGNKDIV